MKLTPNEASAFLMYRMIRPKDIHTIDTYFPTRVPIANAEELCAYLQTRVSQAGDNTAIALSGGIDSAILAKFMPKGSIAYTFKCVVPGVNVIDETPVAAAYAQECGLDHRIIEIYWEDFEKFAPLLMKNKKAPIHSIEVQIYKAAMQAKEDGIDTLVFGEAADAVYGGQSNILSKDWRFGEFVDRFTYLMPYKALKESSLELSSMKKWERGGFIDPYQFMSHVYIQESVASYINPAELANIKTIIPYAETFLNTELDYIRIRRGENKYLVREVFKKLYPSFNIPEKIPMPRPMNEWLKDWKGPIREEFWQNSVEGLTGDQKWLLWSLEKFLNIPED